VCEAESLLTPCTETSPLRLKLPCAHSRRFRGARVLLWRVFVSWNGSRHTRERKPQPRAHSKRRIQNVILHISTSFRTWIEKSSLTPLSCRVSAPHGEDMPEACPYSSGAIAFPFVSFVYLRGQKRWTGVRRNSLHSGVTVHTVTQTERTVLSMGFSCCYFLWKKVTKELAESERTLQSPPRAP
jgi:hypothetical protein